MIQYFNDVSSFQRQFSRRSNIRVNFTFHSQKNILEQHGTGLGVTD